MPLQSGHQGPVGFSLTLVGMFTPLPPDMLLIQVCLLEDSRLRLDVAEWEKLGGNLMSNVSPVLGECVRDQSG